MLDLWQRFRFKASPRGAKKVVVRHLPHEACSPPEHGRSLLHGHDAPDTSAASPSTPITPTTPRTPTALSTLTTLTSLTPLTILTTLTILTLAGCAPSKTKTELQKLQDQPLDPDLDALKKTDPKQILYRETTRIATGLKEPRGIAASANGIFVAGDKIVVQFGPDGKRIGSVPMPAEPQCVAQAPDGKVYVGASDHVIQVDGATVREWPPLGPKSVVTSIVADKDSVWVADAGTRLVVRYSQSGQILAVFGKRDPATQYPGLIVPSPHLDLAVAPGGNVYVTNPGTHRVETHAPDGKLLATWGKEGPEIDRFCGCCNPTDIAASADGSVITSEKGLLRVKLYDCQGKFVGVVAGAEQFNETVTGLDLAVFKDKVYVLDPFDKVVRVYASKSGAKP